MRYKEDFKPFLRCVLWGVVFFVWCLGVFCFLLMALGPSSLLGDGWKIFEQFDFFNFFHPELFFT